MPCRSCQIQRYSQLLNSLALSHVLVITSLVHGFVVTPAVSVKSGSVCLPDPNFMHALAKECGITFNDLVAARFDSNHLDFTAFTTPASKRLGTVCMIGAALPSMGSARTSTPKLSSFFFSVILVWLFLQLLYLTMKCVSTSHSANGKNYFVRLVLVLAFLVPVLR